MDSIGLVEGGVEGLVRIAVAFRAAGIPVTGVYLIKFTTDDNEDQWVLRLVVQETSADLDRRMVTQLVALQRDRALPLIDPLIRIHIAASDDAEVSRVLDYAERLGGPPVIIRGVMWQGLFIEYAVVALIPERNAAAA